MNKIIFKSILIICNICGLQLNELSFINDRGSACQNQPDGIRLPVDSNCNKFILCDGGFLLELSCRASEPHFDRCTGKCVNDLDVCQLRDCNSPSPTTTTSTTTPATIQSTTTTTPTVPTVPTGFPTASTTRYQVPTVPTGSVTTTLTTTLTPTGCTPICSPENYPALNCDCAEQYQCSINECRCDTSIECPIICPDECGCIENCDCLPSGQCTCKNDGTQCPFDSSDCTRICGCMANCDCGDDQTRCICLEECNCFNAWDCAFHPSECEANCGCPERCENTCIGNFCKCDGNTGCPG